MSRIYHNFRKNQRVKRESFASVAEFRGKFGGKIKGRLAGSL